MRTIGTDLLAQFGLEVTTICTLWLLTRKDDSVFAFTDFDQDIVFDGVTYVASTGFSPSDIAFKSDLSVSNLEVQGVLDAGFVTEADLMAGLFDYAEIIISMVNYTNLAQGAVILERGTLGEVSINRNQFTAELRGLSQNLSQTFGEVYSPSCRAILGDSRCKFNIAGVTFPGTVDSASDNANFTSSDLVQPLAYYTGGVINWVSGSNAGLSMEIKAYINDTITLSVAMPYTIERGDTFNAVAGCDKQFTTCQQKFNNVVNFRGEPYVPGMDAMLTTAGTFQ